jgi:HSP20 family molecular chaperone IbpA
MSQISSKKPHLNLARFLLEGIAMTYYIYSNNGKVQKLDLNAHQNGFTLDKLSNEYICEIEVPGFSREDLDVSVKTEDLGELITIKGNSDKRKAETSVWVPSAADASLAKASAKNGLLTIAVPLKNSFQPKKLKVE